MQVTKICGGDVRVALPLFQEASGGAIPTSPHHYIVKPCKRAEIRDFIELWHYSKSINGLMSSYCFKLTDDARIVGAIMFGKLAMANAWRKYAAQEGDILELRRLVCIDNTPKNTESYFIGYCLRWLKKHTDVKIIISYADPNYGHRGTVYKATNFTASGMTAPGKIIVWNGKKYHDKAIRTKYKGRLKPFAQELKNALENGEAHYVAQKPKIIYTKEL